MIQTPVLTPSTISFERQSSTPPPAATSNESSSSEEMKEDSQTVPKKPPQLVASLSQVGPPPPMPTFLKRKSPGSISHGCGISDAYRDAIESCEDGQFCGIEGLAERHNYKDSGTKEIPPLVMKTIVKEIRKDLPQNIELSAEASMFVRFDEERPQFLQAILTGVHGTPYESGCFLFDIFLPDSYPHTNCLVTHTSPNGSLVSANNGPGGFSPNLHKDSGKVCLSLLGTWDGPGWESGKSNVYQVLSSILWMILGADHPYYMEPSFGGWEGTAPTTDHDPEVTEYDEEVYFGTSKWAILEILKSPPKGFEEVIRAHFRVKKNTVLETIQRWRDEGSDSLKVRLDPVLQELKAELEKLQTPEDLEEAIGLANLEIQFIEEKMKYLQSKIEACKLLGHDPIEKVPLAFRRCQMGPELLKAAKQKLERHQQTLAAMKTEKS